ncbi:eukaryotic translation initiation factor 2-alpha kinase 4 like protein [Danaus plexippus plexippus]|uniref:non-specific serine/threonine protein kinase n=1 Tax=Danaus plexippus plexippus TaxID=278856 RepID=A0A212FG33_DANPL|nr:eukaryotic translation initiation factor 2-alpha kinase 4 like protein [Danaus plexippus plexippus]
MSSETNQERQDNELFALKAIYGDAAVDNRKKSVWNEWRPLDVLLTLKPLQNTEGDHCWATLQFVCCHNYPDKLPTISIHKMQGLSDPKKLLTELQELAAQLCGEVMIFQLAQHTEQFLRDHYKPTLSCYDEMVKEKIEMEKLKKHDLEVKEFEELKHIKDEIQKRQEALRSGRDRIPSCNLDINENGQGDIPKLVFYADEKMSPIKKVSKRSSDSIPCCCNIKGIQVLRYTQRNSKKVYIGNCIGHSSNGSTTYLAIDDDGDGLVAKKWTLSVSSDYQIRNRQLNAIQQDLKIMSRLKHPSLAPYTAMEMITESKRNPRQIIYIFRDFVLGSSMRYLKEKSKFGDQFESLKLLRHIGMGLFSALKGLHSANVLHRDVRSETVFLEESGAVKLVGASLDIRLSEILDGDSICDRQTKSHDIYAAAQLLLSVLTEESGQEMPPDLPNSVKDFFSRCLTEDEHLQWSAEQLVNHAFLVDAPTKLPNSKDNNDNDSDSEGDDGAKRISNMTSLANGHSRLNVEFEILTWLGKGAFGDVVKVRNKLDGGFYAIKHVKLNPKSVELNKKITREVKLLSRLNHENVVRYYNAWVETITETEIEESQVVETPVKKGDSLSDVVAKLGQVQINWSMSEGPGRVRDEWSDSDDDSDDDEPWFNITSPEEDSSSLVAFEGNDAQSEPTPTEESADSKLPLKQVLYIQMEFCEKNTLRQAIDDALYHDHFRAWRLFREILEGLAHVHQKGMIHRDLKPVNIFLDSNDHVKIGDFGLATKVFTGPPVEDKQSLDDTEGLLTGKVGTTLYVAPELQQSASKVIYNQKVDIYSLGIILFEMFHPPFDTGTERYIVLNNLRKKEIVMPKDFTREENAKQIHVIRWLLDHDASLRPTSLELLGSEHVPRAVPEGALSGLLSHTLSSRGSRGYQRLITACLDQKPSAAEDFTYHSGVKPKDMEIIAGIKDAVVKVFQSHGAIEFAPPLLTSRSKHWDQYANAVKVMTSSGSVCHLPHDLRLPFARHTAYTGTKYARRYVIDRVYRDTERTIQGFHPREIIECAFDIVNPKTDTLWPDAELLVVASRAAQECSLKVTIQLNHTELLKTLLLACGVPLDKQSGIYPVLVDVSLGRITNLQLQTHLTTLCVTHRDVTNMLRLMEADVPVGEVREVARVGRGGKGEMAIRELEAVVTYARSLGCEIPITVAPFLAYKATQHCGVFWQMSLVRQDSKCKHRARDLIAVGGRYDNLVEEFWKVARAVKDNNTEFNCTSVGFSLSLERVAAILKGLEVEIPPVVRNSECNTVCVCVSTKSSIESKCARLARSLWSGGYSAVLWIAAAADAHHRTRAPLVLEHDQGHVLVSCWEARSVRVFKQSATDVLEFVKQKINPYSSIRSSEFTNNRTISWPEGEKTNTPYIFVSFINTGGRISKTMRRSHEVQINNQITTILTNLGLSAMFSRVRVSVVALNCDSRCVRQLSAAFTVPLEARDLPKAIANVSDLFPKYQTALDEVLSELTNIVKQNNQSRGPDETQLYAFYSLPYTLCRLVT